MEWALQVNNRPIVTLGGSVAEWLACWTRRRRVRVQIAVATLSGNSLRQTVHTHRASVHQAAKLDLGYSGLQSTFFSLWWAGLDPL